MDTCKITTKKIIFEDIEFYIPDNNLNNLFEIVLIAKGKELIPTVCIVKEVVDEDYDYDYEDNLVYNGLNINYVYIPIKFNPFNGKEFVFDITKTYNRTEDFFNITKKISEINLKRKSKSKTKDLFDAEKELNKLFDDIPKILYADEILKEYDESYLISPLCIITEDFNNC